MPDCFILSGVFSSYHTRRRNVSLRCQYFWAFHMRPCLELMKLPGERERAGSNYIASGKQELRKITEDEDMDGLALCP